MSSGNTAEQWGRLWSDAPKRIKELRFSVEKAEKSFIWSSVEEALGKPDYSRLSTVELGAGSGTISAVFARNGARVTVLDYSQEALNTSSALFGELGLAQESLLADALRLPNALAGQFDVAMSFGLAEHFEGADRASIIRAHFELLKPGGLAVISVPNRNCWPYRLWKARREALGKWQFGLEMPFSRSELAQICHSIGVTDFEIAGSPFVASLEFLFPLARWKRSMEKRILKDKRFDPDRIKPERKGRLGAYLGYALVLIARKPS